MSSVLTKQAALDKKAEIEAAFKENEEWIKKVNQRIQQVHAEQLQFKAQHDLICSFLEAQAAREAAPDQAPVAEAELPA